MYNEVTILEYHNDIIYKILFSIKEKQYIKNYELNISPTEFYNLIMDMADKELLINIPDPEYKNNCIVFFDIEGSVLTLKGKEKLTEYLSKEKVMNNEIFIVHGHDGALKTEVARTIEKVGLNVTILHEKPSSGLTIIQKLEKYAATAGYAVILMTPDDRGKEKNDSKYRDRARQNVVLELGYFIGKLGVDKVCAIHTKDIELPSDINGVIYIPYDSNGGWKIELMKELENAGCSINWKNL